MITNSLARLLAPLKRRMQTMIARGVIELVKSGVGDLDTVQVSVLADETIDGVELFQHYGLASSPLPGSEAIVLSVGGKRSHSVIIATANRKLRLDVGPGESALYTEFGSKVHLKADGSIDVVSPIAVNVTAPTVGITGNLTVTGEVSDALGSMNEMRDVFNGHTHPYEDAAPAPAVVKATQVTATQMA